MIVALLAAALAWFGPRSKQWRTNDGRPTEEAKPLQTLPDESTTDQEGGDEDDDPRFPPPEGPAG